MHTVTALRLSTAMAMALGSASAFAADQPAEAQAGQPAAASATVDSSAVAADAGGAAGTTSATQTASGGLQEIIVTAQRRAENLQRAALAITAVPADALARAGVTDVAQLTRVAPAIQIGTLGGSFTTFYLRGVGNFTANSLSDSAVSVNLDGVPLVRSNAIQGIFYDLERVEVLKGPQGTLYGRNATGGAINVLTAKPRLGEFSGYLNGEYGNYDAVKISTAINLPAGDNGAFRVAGYFSDRDGFYSDGTGDDKMRAIRVQMASQLTDTFKLTVGGDYAYIGGKGSGATVHGLDPDKMIGLSDPRAGAIYAQTLSPSAGAFLTPVANDQFNNNRYWGMFAQADIETGIGTFTILPSYRDADVHFRNYGGSFAINERLKDEQTSLEVRLASDDSRRLTYLLGGFFLDEKANERPGFTEQFFAAWGDFLSKTKSYAAFGRLAYKITDEFRITGGVRYTIDKKRADIDAVNSIVICPTDNPLGGIFGTCAGTPSLPNTFDPPAFAADADRNPIVGPGGSPVPYGANGALLVNFRQRLSPSRTFKKATYRVGVEYDVAPQSMLYASYETGFKSGGFFSSIIDPVYQPETISAITLGSKNRFLDNKLQLNVEAFWWDYKDQQVSHFRLTPVPGGGGATVSEFVTENVGKTRVRGIEVEARGRVGLGTTLYTTVQYLDAKYRNFTYRNPASNGPPVTGCPFTPAGAEFVVNCSGRRAINAPEWTITGGIEQAFEFGNGGRVIFNADARYETASYKGFEQLPAMLQGDYFQADLQLQYVFPASHITIGGFVNNVTNKKVVGFSTPHPFGPSLVVDNLRPPRQYGVRAGYKF